MDAITLITNIVLVLGGILLIAVILWIAWEERGFLLYLCFLVVPSVLISLAIYLVSH